MPAKRNDTARAVEAQIIMQRRAEQLSQVVKVIGFLEEQFKNMRDLQKKIVVLDSVSLGLYEEIDKLSKKAPADAITDLALEQVNDVIRETKELLSSDTYIQRLKEFFPAGDNPQHRDVVMVLRQVRQGLERYNKEAESKRQELHKRLNEARTLKTGIDIFLSNKGTFERDDFRYADLNTSKWFSSTHPKRFLIENLDEIDILQYFEVSISDE